MDDGNADQPVAPDEQTGFGREALDLGLFTRDISLKELVGEFTLGDHVGGQFFQVPIDFLSPTRTTGNGRTNLTLIRPTILQTDTSAPIIPHAGFDRTKSPDRNPAVSVHFDPTAYGITTPSTCVVEFVVECSQPCTFEVSAFALGAPVGGTGSRTVNGKSTITAILRQLPPAPGAHAAITQTAGANWAWFRTGFSHPPLVFERT